MTILDDKMISTMHRMFEMQGLNPAETRTGFHWPPFNTVHHLHLHIISPISNISFIKRVMFKPDSYWFVGVSINTNMKLSTYISLLCIN